MNSTVAKWSGLRLVNATYKLWEFYIKTREFSESADKPVEAESIIKTFFCKDSKKLITDVLQKDTVDLLS